MKVIKNEKDLPEELQHKLEYLILEKMILERFITLRDNYSLCYKTKSNKKIQMILRGLELLYY